MNNPRFLLYSRRMVGWLFIVAMSGCTSQANLVGQPLATPSNTPAPHLDVTQENLQFYDFQFTSLNPNDSRLEKTISQEQAVSSALQFEARGKKATFVTTQVGFSDGATLPDLSNERLVWLVTFHGVDSLSSGPPESTHQVSHELTVVIDAHTGEAIASFAMSANPPEPRQQMMPTSPQISTHSPISETTTLTPIPPATNEPPTLGPTQVFQTNAVFDRTANAAPNLTSTAIVREIQATVTPRIFQSIRSPDGKWRAEVILYDCAQVVSPDPGYTHAYELLKIASWTVETQLLSCGGQGAAGLGGLFWSANSRFFYYTDAREGWPDGGYPWIRPMSRFDTSTGKDEALSTAVYAPDRQKIAGGQGTDLVIWDIRSGAVTRFSSPHPEQSWINWLSWSPDGRSLVYLTQTNCQDRYPCPSSLTRVDLGTQTQSLLLGEQDPPMLQVDWDGPNQLALFGSDFSTRYIYDLKSGVLSPVPEATLTAAAMNRSTPVPATETPAPTYPPDPAFPADLYPPDNPFRQPIDRSGKDVLGHGCPSLLGVKTQEGLTVETIKPILEAVRTGDVYQIRTHSDIAYWPATGLGLRRQDSFLLSGNIAVQPAIQSPLADGLTQACGAEIARASWWAQVTADDGISDYFLIQRKDRWLVWFRVYDYGQFAG